MWYLFGYLALVAIIMAVAVVGGGEPKRPGD